MRRWIVGLVVIAGALFGANYLLRQLIRAKTFQAFGELVSRVETTERVVALTFDDGPVPSHTEEVLQALAKDNVRATFYLVGRDIERHPAQARAIATAGHELGNHSYTHERMVWQSVDFMREEIERTDAAIRRTGYRGPITFRPPYGRKALTLPYYLQSVNRITVTWDVEAVTEARKNPRPEIIAADVLRLVRPGSIILLHVMSENRGPSRLAFPAVIGALRAMKYRFVTVSDLLKMR